MSIDELVRAIYQKRSSKSSSTQARYRDELSVALAGLEKEGLVTKTPSVTNETAIASASQPTPTATAQATVPQVTVKQQPLIGTVPVSTSQQPIPTQVAQSSIAKKDELSGESYKILNLILKEMQAHSTLLDTINKSVGGVTTAVDKSTLEISKAVFSFSGKAPFSGIQKINTQSTAINTRTSMPLPKTQLALDKIG